MYGAHHTIDSECCVCQSDFIKILICNIEWCCGLAQSCDMKKKKLFDFREREGAWRSAYESQQIPNTMRDTMKNENKMK